MEKKLNELYYLEIFLGDDQEEHSGTYSNLVFHSKEEMDGYIMFRMIKHAKELPEWKNGNSIKYNWRKVHLYNPDIERSIKKWFKDNNIKHESFNAE